MSLRSSSVKNFNSPAGFPEYRGYLLGFLHEPHKCVFKIASLVLVHVTTMQNAIFLNLFQYSLSGLAHLTINLCCQNAHKKWMQKGDESCSVAIWWSKWTLWTGKAHSGWFYALLFACCYCSNSTKLLGFSMVYSMWLIGILTLSYLTHKGFDLYFPGEMYVQIKVTEGGKWPSNCIAFKKWDKVSSPLNCWMG